jgi:xylulokinase
VSLLAIDMGTSSCKAVLFSEDGRVLNHKSCTYAATKSPHPTWAEMAAENFWYALSNVCREVSAESGDAVKALAISSHGETFVPVDQNGEAVGPAILNYDNRATAESEWLEETFGRRALFDITGLSAHPMYPIAKILWIKRHQPQIWSSAKRFLAVPDYLLTQLGMPALIDYSLASRSLAFDIRKHEWCEDILRVCQLEVDQFATPVPAGHIAGELSLSAAADLGLKAGTVVVVSGHDQPCAALGSGVLEEGRISASLGTYECLVSASSAPALNEHTFTANLNTYCHVVPDRYVTLAYFPSGIMLEWFLRLIASRDDATQLSTHEVCSRLEADTRDEPSGLFVTPHLLGTCNPDFNPKASGVIAGIRPNTSRADIYQGILEGIACEFGQMVELLKAAVGDFSAVHVSGGGVHSPLGLKLRAAFSNCELRMTRCAEAVCMGSAILAGVAIGLYRSHEDGVKKILQLGDTIQPARTLRDSYKIYREQYRLLYSSLAPVRCAIGASN